MLRLLCLSSKSTLYPLLCDVRTGLSSYMCLLSAVLCSDLGSGMKEARKPSAEEGTCSFCVPICFLSASPNQGPFTPVAVLGSCFRFFSQHCQNQDHSISSVQSIASPAKPGLLLDFWIPIPEGSPSKMLNVNNPDLLLLIPNQALGYSFLQFLPLFPHIPFWPFQSSNPIEQVFRRSLGTLTVVFKRLIT